MSAPTVPIPEPMASPTLADLAALQAQVDDLPTAADLDNFYLIWAAVMVVSMQLGFGLIEVGSVRAKNAVSVFFKNLIDVCVGCLAFWSVGWGFYMGDTGDSKRNGFIGNSQFFLGEYDGSNFTRGDYSSWFFQFAFAATAATIVSGAVAERMQLRAYVILSVWLTAFVYPIVAHWGWSSVGWLSPFTLPDADGNMPDRVGTNGMLDFAGSGIVHLVGGVAAFVAAAILGPRSHRFPKFGEKDTPEGKAMRAREFAPHNLLLVGQGTILLWVGWYGFNPGSTLMASGGSSATAGKVAVVTTIGAACGGLSALVAKMFINWGTFYMDVNVFCNGILAGLVAVTAPCALVEPWAAIIIGGIGGLIYLGTTYLLELIHVDDVIGASAVHGTAGIWGVVSVGLFATKSNLMAAYGYDSHYGLFMGGGGEQLGVQLLGCCAIIAWTAVLTAAAAVPLRLLRQMRYSEESERRGGDQVTHGAPGFNYDHILHMILEDEPLLREIVRRGTQGSAPSGGKKLSSTYDGDEEAPDTAASWGKEGSFMLGYDISKDSGPGAVPKANNKTPTVAPHPYPADAPDSPQTVSVQPKSLQSLCTHDLEAPRAVAQAT